VWLCHRGLERRRYVKKLAQTGFNQIGTETARGFMALRMLGLSSFVRASGKISLRESRTLFPRTTPRSRIPALSNRHSPSAGLGSLRRRTTTIGGEFTSCALAFHGLDRRRNGHFSDRGIAAPEARCNLRRASAPGLSIWRKFFGNWLKSGSEPFAALAA